MAGVSGVIHKSSHIGTLRWASKGVQKQILEKDLDIANGVFIRCHSAVDGKKSFSHRPAPEMFPSCSVSVCTRRAVISSGFQMIRS